MLIRLEDKDSRDLFVAERINSIAFQIREMRDQRGWTQRELAAQTGQHQATVSDLENPSYGRYTLTTLKRIASAFDVGLEVRFVPFSELVDRSVLLSYDDLAIAAWDEDGGLALTPELTAAAAMPSKPQARIDPLVAARTIVQNMAQSTTHRFPVIHSSLVGGA